MIIYIKKEKGKDVTSDSIIDGLKVWRNEWQSFIYVWFLL